MGALPCIYFTTNKPNWNVPKGNRLKDLFSSPTSKQHPSKEQKHVVENRNEDMEDMEQSHQNISVHNQHNIKNKSNIRMDFFKHQNITSHHHVVFFVWFLFFNARDLTLWSMDVQKWHGENVPTFDDWSNGSSSLKHPWVKGNTNWAPIRSQPGLKGVITHIK